MFIELNSLFLTGDSTFKFTPFIMSKHCCSSMPAWPLIRLFTSPNIPSQSGKILTFAWQAKQCSRSRLLSERCKYILAKSMLSIYESWLKHQPYNISLSKKIILRRTIQLKKYCLQLCWFSVLSFGLSANMNRKMSPNAVSQWVI